MTRIWLILLLLSLATPLPAEGPAEPAPERTAADAVKVGFIHHFTRFIHWPQRKTPAERDAFVIAVVGDTAMAAQLAILERKGRRVDGLPIRVERVADPAKIPDCSILFIGADAAGRLDAILHWVAGRPVLIIGDTPGLARRGAAINFFLQRGRVRFEINPGALRKSGLAAEAQLYDVARIVE